MRFLSGAVSLALALTSAAVNAQVQNDYEAGVAARQSGNPGVARRLLQAWLAAHPDDLDARLQLAYADLSLGLLDDAETGFAAVVRQAPDYRDAQEGLALVAARRTATRNERTGQFLIEGAISDLSAGSDWTEASADVTLPAGARTTLGGRASYYRRFGLDDVELIGRLDRRAGDDTWLRAHLGGTLHADFRPKISLGAGVDRRLTDRKTVLTLDGSYERFPLQDVVTVSPGLVRYVSNGRGWFTLRGIGTIADGGRLEVGGLLRGDFMPAEGWRVFAGAATGPDTDLGVVTRVKSLFGGVETPVTKLFSITGSVAREWRQTGADRTEFRLGIKTGF